MRALYSLSDLAAMLPADKNVAIVGDGPSKIKYLFNRRRVVSFTINRAAFDYPADIGVVLECHFAQLHPVLPSWVPLVYMTNEDMMELRMAGAIWTAPLFIRWVARRLAPERTLYLQGFDFSPPGRCEYPRQAEQFREIAAEAKCRIVKTSDNPHLPFIETVVPAAGEIL